MKKLLVIIFSGIFAIALCGCNEDVNTFYIHFNSNGGIEVDALEIDDTSDIVLPTEPTKEGYDFDGWYVDQDLDESFDINSIITEEITLYAKWVKKQYSITYVDYDGTVLQEHSFYYQESLSSVISPVDPVRVNHYFYGWSSELPTTMISSDIVITAQYLTNRIYEGNTNNSEIILRRLGDYIAVAIGDTVTISKISDPDYKRELDCSVNYYGIIGPTVVPQMEIYGDYIITGSHNYYEQQHYIFVYKFSDPSYQRIITNSDDDYDVFGYEFDVLENYLIVKNIKINDNAEVFAYYIKEIQIYDLNDENYLVEYDLDYDIDTAYYRYFSNGPIILIIEVIEDESSNRSYNGKIIHIKDSSLSFSFDESSPIANNIDDFYVSGDYLLFHIYDYEENKTAIYITKISDPEYHRAIISPGPNAYWSGIAVKDDYVLLMRNGNTYIYLLSDPDYEMIYHDYEPRGYCNNISKYICSDNYVFVASFNENNVLLYNLADDSYQREFSGEGLETIKHGNIIVTYQELIGDVNTLSIYHENDANYIQTFEVGLIRNFRLWSGLLITEGYLFVVEWVDDTWHLNIIELPE